MSRLLDRLTSVAEEAEQDATTADKAATIAFAYARPEQKNQAIVDAAIKALTPKGPATPVQSDLFIAALAALPPEARARSLNDLQAAINVSRGLAARAGWSILKKRIKDAAQKVDAAIAGANNIAGMSAGNVIAAGDPLTIARAFVAHHLVDGCCTIRRWKGRYHVWKNGIYEEQDDEIVDGMLYAFTASLRIPSPNGPSALVPDKKLIEYVHHALAPLIQVPSETPTCWLDASERQRPAIDRCVFCANGTLAIDPWLAGRADAFIAPTPWLFILRTLATPYDPQAKAPRFERFITEIFDDDADRIMAMRMLFGYWLITATFLQIIVVFSGLPQTGKGSLMKIIEEILGLSCCNPSFEEMGGRFGLEGLVGAQLAILSDVHDTGPNAKSAVEKLLKISGEDSVNVERKHKPALKSLHLIARFILAMNELVALPDVAGAFARRLVVIAFKRSFLGKGHAGLANEIVANEAPGVLLWALDGLRLLQHLMDDAATKGLPTKDEVIRHLRTASSVEDQETLEDLGNPVRVFLRERCCLGAAYSLDLDDVYDEWRNWADRNGHQVRSKSRFTNDLVMATRGAVSVGQRCDANGLRPRVLKGITTPKALHNAQVLAADAAATAAQAPGAAT